MSATSKQWSLSRIDQDRAYAVGAASLAGNDLEFFRRVWAQAPQVYANRLRAVGFEGLDAVLDAGCGFGQWTMCLAALNERVSAVDVSEVRAHLVQEIATAFDCGSTTVRQGELERLRDPDESFDGVFCYSVLMMTDYRRVIAEFHRVLKPGGTLYLCLSGLGWYLRSIAEPRNAAADYDPARMAIETIENSLRHFSEGIRVPGQQVVLSSGFVERLLRDAGFREIAIGAEGTLRMQPVDAAPSFFDGSYVGIEGVYEVVARK